jgi:hypothetical protein
MININKLFFEKIIITIIGSIYIIIPLIFSNFFDFFWINFFHGFEYTKIIIFYFLFSIFFIFFIKNNYLKYNKNIIIFWFLVIISFILSLIFTQNLSDSIFWNFERPHWTIFYFILLLFFICLVFCLNKKIENIINSTILFTLIPIFLYAILQYIWYIDASSIYSTFWNSNYLAGYILLVLPILFFKYTIKSNEFIAYFTILLFLIITSKSFFWILLFWFYFLYKVFYVINNIKIKKIVILFIILILFIFWYIYLTNDKILSLYTRFAIWENVFVILLTNNIQNLIFWYWFDTLWNTLDLFKTNTLNKFVSNNFLIDRSHNFLLDILYSIWFFWFFIIFIPIIKILYKNINSYSKEIIIIFLLFFFLNIPVISHFLIVIFALSREIKKP